MLGTKIIKRWKNNLSLSNYSCRKDKVKFKLTNVYMRIRYIILGDLVKNIIMAF